MSPLIPTKIELGDVRLNAREIAGQGNAVLGIRASGKSYLGTLLGERLMDAGIPIVAFDPIGVWRYLQVPGKSAGYPVVVAGGEHGNLPLTPEGAPEIVRAAMREGVSLILDLYSMKLSKADWRRIVERCIRVLLYENKSHGLRHVFIEEAAEFAPQVVGRDYGTVYAEVEKLARMGGNALLGYTLISQRAEQVNKAVLELCDNLFLFRQKGRLSLTALSKWLDIGSAKGGGDVIASLPTLPQGVCWAWPAGHDTPVKVEVPQKRSFHPDRSKMHGDLAEAIANQSAVDVGAFVETMKGSLEKITAEAEANDPVKLKRRIAELEREKAKAKAPAPASPDPAALEAEYQRGYIDGAAYEADRLGKMMLTFASDFALATGETKGRAPKPAPRHVAAPPTAKAIVRSVSTPAAPRTPVTASGEFTGPQLRILRSLSMWRALGHEEPTKVMVAAVAGYSPNSGGYANLLGQLRGRAIEYPQPGRLKLLGDPVPMSVDEGRDLLLGTLSGPQRKLVDALLRGDMSKAELAEATDYSPTSGGYANLLGQLRSMGLADYPSPGRVALDPWVFGVLT